MKALRKMRPQRGAQLESVPIPTPGPIEVLVRVRAASICGTDLHIYGWDRWSASRIHPPMTFGHEFCGYIEKVGSEVTSVNPGDFVSAEMHVNCGHCRPCRMGQPHVCQNVKIIGIDADGCFAEFVVIPIRNIWKIDPAIPEQYAAILDPLGNAVHTALSFDLVGEDVLITGAGPIGLMAVAVCRHVGARNIVITDVNDYRLALAKTMGATCAVRADRQSLAQVMAEVDMHEGFDVGLEMSGNPKALRDMIGGMNNGGKVALLGILADEAALDWNEVIFKGLTLKGIYGREMYETWYKMLAMLQSGLDVTPVITHRLPMTQFETGFSALHAGQACKVVLDINA